jgi:hypothetical protein
VSFTVVILTSIKSRYCDVCVAAFTETGTTESAVTSGAQSTVEGGMIVLYITFIHKFPD